MKIPNAFRVGSNGVTHLPVFVIYTDSKSEVISAVDLTARNISNELALEIAQFTFL